MKYSCIKIIVLLVQFIHIEPICADFYTSVSSLENLLTFEMELLKGFEAYINRVTNTNRKMKLFLDQIERIYARIPGEFHENALNYIQAHKRIAVDWKMLKHAALDDHSFKVFARNITQMIKDKYVKPSKADLEGASIGLARLQSTYGLNAEDISNGVLLGNEYDSKLSAHDCFELGRNLYEAKNYQYAAEWLLRARVLLADELEEAGLKDDKANLHFPFITDVEILEYLAPTMYNIGNWKMAMVFNNELLAQEPKSKYGLDNKRLFANKVVEQRNFNYLQHWTDYTKPTTPQKSYVQDLYESVCRGSAYQTPREQRNLRCRYATKNVPFCLIAPFKMEELNHDPFVAVYHDVIYDNEIKQIINIAEDYVERSKIEGLSESVFSEIRTSKNTWLYYEDHKFLKSVRQRLEDVTGLNLLYAEPLQVANYGIGGHYGPHYDFTQNPNETYNGHGNRILTALFYINVVELGGATAFPFLRIAVPPKRGTLLVWFNMHESLELDYRTRHAGCPVLKGSKWICNQWFHELGHEIVRPCSLERNGNISISYKDLT